MHLILTRPRASSAPRSSQLSRLSILSRNTSIPLAANHPHVKVIQHSNFGEYSAALLEDLRGARGVIWALGTSQNAVPHDKYVEVTRD